MDRQTYFEGITACGENCAGCAKKAAGQCRGCRESDGCCEEWAGTGRCPIHSCVQAHGVLFCGLCGSFPCKELPRLLNWNPNAAEHLAALAEQYRQQTE